MTAQAASILFLRVSTSRTAFVTGGTGFLGMNLVDALLAAGWRVVALHREASNVDRLRSRGVILAPGSLGDRASLDRAIPEGCDAVFHVAGNISLWSGGDAQQTLDNVDGSRNVGEAALAKKVGRFIHTSSVSAWGPAVTASFDETLPQRGGESLVHYEKTKFEGEREIKKLVERGLAAVIMNPCHIVGRYDEKGWSSMLRLVHDRKLPGIPPGAGSFCEAGAVSRAHVAAVDRGKVGENYLLGGADATYVEMVRVVGEVLGEPVSAKPLSLWMIEALGRVSQWGSYVTRRAPLVTPETAIALGHPYAVRCDKAIRELGYEVTPLREMLEIAHTWMVEQHILPKRSPTPGAAAKAPTAPANKGEIELVVRLDRPLAPEAAHALKAAVSKRAAAATCTLARCCTSARRSTTARRRSPRWPAAASGPPTCEMGSSRSRVSSATARRKGVRSDGRPFSAHRDVEPTRISAGRPRSRS